MNTQEAFDRLTGINLTALGKSIAALAAIPLPNEPICNICGQPCDVRQVDNNPWNEAGGLTCNVGCTGESFCCKAPYTIGGVRAAREGAAARKMGKQANPYFGTNKVLEDAWHSGWMGAQP